MITAWDVYWITRLDAFNAFFHGIAIVGGFTTVLLLVGAYCFYSVSQSKYTDEDKKKPYKNTAFRYGKWAIVSSVVVFVFILLCVITPSTKTAVAMWGVPKIVNNEELRQVPGNATTLLNEKLKEWISEHVDEGKEAMKDVIVEATE